MLEQQLPDAAVLVTVDVGDETLQLVVDDELAPEIGDRGWVVVAPRRTLVFDTDGELVEAAPVGDPVATAAR